VPDRSLLTGAYLDTYIAGKINLKPRTFTTNKEIIELYWKPALGHLRLVDVRDHHVAEAVREMMKINRPLPDGEKPSEMLRRMLAARADDERRHLAPGERRRKKSAKPLSPARVARAFAVLRAAMNAAVPGKIMVSPCAGVELPRAPKVRPLAWTAQREAAFRTALGKRMRAAPAERDLTTVRKQEMWAAPDLRPAPVMVWLPAHMGRFLDCIAGERLFALFCLVAYCGLRRDEVLGLSWAEVDLDEGIAYVRETGSGGGPKSEAGTRVVPLPASVAQPLRAWRAQQAADRLAWGSDWPDTDLVFTREDGTPVPGQWVSARFETLAYRAGLPPVRFHDLRHGAASLAKAAGLDSKYIAALLGHARSSFTDDVYVTLFPEVAKAAAEAAAAIVPRARGAPKPQLFDVPQALKRPLDNRHRVAVPDRRLPQQPEVFLVAGNQFRLSHLVLAFDGLLDHQVVVQPEACSRPDRNCCFEGDDPEFKRCQTDDRHEPGKLAGERRRRHNAGP
jgi:integrase